MQIVPRIFKKNTAQNSPKHDISSEKFIFFVGRGPSQSLYPNPSPSGLTPRSQPGLLDPTLRSAKIQAGFTTMYATDRASVWNVGVL